MSDSPRPVAVFDTNLFNGDREASRASLNTVLEGVEAGDFDLVVPTVVIEELVKQYPIAAKATAKKVRAALAGLHRELNALGWPTLEFETPEYDPDGYRRRLLARLDAVGVAVREPPADLSPAIEWAVHRRKPFKSSGVGFQDAAIWLTVCDLASEVAPRKVLLVSTNKSDFADEDPSLTLASVLAADLEGRGLQPDQVEYVETLDRFLERFAIPLAGTDQRASRLVSAAPSAEAIKLAIADALVGYDLDALDLGTWLEDGPIVVAVEVDDVALNAAAELSDSRLHLAVTADVRAEVEAYLGKADAEADPPPLLHVIDDDVNDYVCEVGGEIRLQIPVDVVTDLRATDIGVDLGEIALAAEEVARRDLFRIDPVSLAEQLVDPATEGVFEVGNYITDPPVQSELATASVDFVREATVGSFEPVDDETPEGLPIAITFLVDADVSWTVTVVAPEDLTIEADAWDDQPPTLQDSEMGAPLVIEATAIFDPRSSRLGEIELVSVQLRSDEYLRRDRARTANDPAYRHLIDLADTAEDA